MDCWVMTIRQFFYRTVHRWYFDMPSLSGLARHCGFDIVQENCVQRFGISNALAWLRDRKPTGDQALPSMDDPLAKPVLEKLPGIQRQR